MHGLLSEQLSRSALVDWHTQPFVTVGCAARFIEQASDAELLDCVHKYYAFFGAASHATRLRGPVPADQDEVDATTPLNFEAELIWRSLLLSPLQYAGSCQQALLTTVGDPVQRIAEGAISPMVAAVRQQLSFMRQVLRLHEVGAITTASLTTALPQYRAMLVQAGGINTGQHDRSDTTVPVPGVLADLVWHTAMLRPARYEEECLRIAGRFVDHHGDP